MQDRKIRVSVALEGQEEPEAFLDRLEQALGRREKPAQILRKAGVLSLWLTERELSLVRQLPGVRKAGPEGRCELPPRPAPPEKAVK